ncbi:yippee-domain-containing protein, partial [Canariomyces notabilis]
MFEIMSRRRPSAPTPPDAAPRFPLYLLPTLRIPFRRRDVSDPVVSPPPLASEPTTPPSSVPLTRTQPDTLRCANCATDLAYHAQIVSKGFMGRHGRAYLATDLINIRVGRPEDRHLVTGPHVVADISCVGCGAVVGWKYVDARVPGQKYKVGKFILETGKVVGFASWEVVPSSGRDGVKSWHAGEDEEGDDESLVVFDSEDEDECEDIFAGVWDAKVVARRRRSK